MRRPSHTHETIDPDAATGDDSPRAFLVFDRQSLRSIDRAAVEEYGIPGMVLMENAARGLADHAMGMLASADASPRVLIVCGPGNNGGDGYALARIMHNRGAEVFIAAQGAPTAASDAGINRAICERMRLPICDAAHMEDHRDVALIVDAMFGTGLDREVTQEAADVIRWINDSERPVLAADVPSGMDCDTGRALGACVRADATVTFVGLKPGFLELDAQKLLGEVVVADIGAPRELLERFGRRVAIPRRPDAPQREAGVEAGPARRRD